jgi:phage/plasmid primase-like uncharacterized protein
MLITRAKNIPIEAELARRNHQLMRVGGELVGPCPVCGGRDRFAVNVRRQIWNCRQCTKGGDILDLIQHIDNVSLAEAVAVLTSNEPGRARQATTAAPTVKEDNGDDERKRLETAQRIWQETVAIKGTDGEAYLTRRGIRLDNVPNHGGLRWHPYCSWEGGTTPCIVARFTDAATGEARGIWRRPVDGSKPKSRGPTRGCVIRLWPDEAVTTGLVIGEGVETTLSVATRCTHRGALLQPAWAAASAGNLENLAILPGINELTILADRDLNGRGQQAARRCAMRWKEAGCEVVTLTPPEEGTDFNDLVMRYEQQHKTGDGACPR